MNSSSRLARLDAAAPDPAPLATFETGGPATTRDALADIMGAAGRWELWLNMAWNDIRQRYRGSMLGPFWVTINMGLMVALLATIYSKLLGAAIKEYLPFLTLGFLVWRWMETSATESTLVFIVSNRYIKQLRLPLTLFVFRLLARNLIVFAHNFVVYVVVAVIVGLNPGWQALLAIPGLVLTTICVFWITMLFGMLSARFRDFPQIIASLIQIVFYVTPILWEPRLLGPKRFILVDYNPVYYFLEIVRSPLMGHAPPVGFWKVTVGITLAMTAICFPIFRRFRGRLAYWV
jgi:ABC-2 type transport system permease protein/lipopolysaccharide transport system permease protein